jgi:hypothetical protein
MVPAELRIARTLASKYFNIATQALRLRRWQPRAGIASQATLALPAAGILG